MKLVVATRSAHKLAEIRALLARVPGLELLGLEEAGVGYHPEEEQLEPYETFEENALSKARYFQRRSGLPTVADDSGIEVEALDGAPGVRSKRFAPVPAGVEGGERDRANNRHLLALLAARADAGSGAAPQEITRRARYVCAVALARGVEEPLVLRGEVEGRILAEPRGEGGFGYDPLFLDIESGRTFAELSPAEKNARSHRGRAFGALAERLAGWAPGGTGAGGASG